MRAGVFISYAHADTSLVKPLYTALVDAGQDVWRDTEDLPPGVDWRDGVMQAIEGSAVVVFVLTPESARSEWCTLGRPPDSERGSMTASTRKFDRMNVVKTSPIWWTCLWRSAAT